LQTDGRRAARDSRAAPRRHARRRPDSAARRLDRRPLGPCADLVPPRHRAGSRSEDQGETGHLVEPGRLSPGRRDLRRRRAGAERRRAIGRRCADSRRLYGREPRLQQLPRHLPGAGTTMTVRIWDLPVRLFHWAVVLLVPALWATHEWDLLDTHILLGEIMLGLVFWRLLWGVLGSSTARFAAFVRGPGAVLRYLKGGGKAFGHNPLGGWSVVA